MSESMEQAHRRDSQTERLMRDAYRAIDAVLADNRRLSERDKLTLVQSRDLLNGEADQIVAVWD